VSSYSLNFKVGLFILAGIVALMFMSFKMGSLTGFSAEGEQRFHIYFNAISGISEKTPVSMAGVKIGTVGRLFLDKRKVKVTVFLDADTKIPVDSVATIQSAGLLGEKFINIRPGASDEFVPNDGVLENSLDAANLDEIMSKLSSALDDIKKFTQGMGTLFGEEEGVGAEKSPFGQIVDNAREASELLKLMLAENRKSLRMGLSNVKDFSGNLNELMVENRETFKDTLGNLKASTSKLDSIMFSVEKIAAKIEKGEGTFGRLVYEEEVYENINETLIGAQSFMGSAEKMQLAIGTRAEYQESLQKTKSYFSLSIRPKEDKYYLFEVSEDIRRDDLQIRNAMNSLLFTLLVNKRYGNLNMKAGLIESTGGLGLDYYAWSDSLRLSADIFSFSGYDINSKNPQLKLTGKYYLQKYIYAYFGADDLLNEYYKTYFGGVGIMVDESDFKFLLSII